MLRSDYHWVDSNEIISAEANDDENYVVNRNEKKKTKINEWKFTMIVFEL